MLPRIGLVVALSLLGAPGIGAAQTQAGAQQLAEVRTGSLRLLRALDGNGDGAISRDEFRLAVSRHVTQRVRVRFSQLDRDGDGRVTRAETIGMEPARFARFDVNGDGAFTLAELRATMRRQALRRAAHLFAAMDADGDLRCTMSELGLLWRAMALRKAPGQAPGVSSRSARPKASSKTESVASQKPAGNSARAAL